MTLTLGSLFTGIGGLDLGLERAGMEIRWMCEQDEFCRKALEKHWPGVSRFDDVRNVGARNLEPVDVICGGFPCQDVSVAGKGAGLAGARSGLWYEYLRIVRELRPRWVVVENVPALRTRGADAVCEGLEGESYTCWPLVVGARHVGAPHRRDRVFIVGRLADAPRVGERESNNKASPESRERTRESLGWGSGSLEHPEKPRLEGQRERAVTGQAQQLEPLGPGCSEQPELVADSIGHPLRVQPERDKRDRRGERETVGEYPEPRPDGAGELADSDGGRREGVGRGGIFDGERTPLGNDPNGRYVWPAGPGEPQRDWEEPRVLSNRDLAARLSPEAKSPLGRSVNGVPRGLARWRRDALKALGNAVVPQVGEVIGETILRAHRGS